MSHGVVCKYHYRENFRVWLTSVTVWLFFREGVAKCPCKCGSVSEIYTYQKIPEFFYALENMDWTLIAFREDEESKAELKRRMDHWQEMARATGTRVDLR